MEFSSRTSAVQSFVKNFEKMYNTKHKLQRKEGQWNAEQKSLLIDSLLRSIPVDPIRCEIKELVPGKKIRYIFDGVQRSTNIVNFCNNEYKLKLPSEFSKVTIDNVDYDINGKKFNELDEVVQDKINAAEITIFLFTDCTEQDIREMYRRQNNGKILTNTQKRTAIENDEMSKVVFSLADHNFFEKVLTPTQIKKDIARDLIRETLMLICSVGDNDFTSFKTKDIDKFVRWYGDNLDDTTHYLIGATLDRLSSLFNNKELTKINSSSIPMIIYAGYTVLKENKDYSVFENKLKEFIETYPENETYKQYCGRGTSGKDMVQGRLSYWNDIINNI